ncbi:putative non-specific lipid-transfer protein type 2 [Lupinus albus]|uniref:Putative non-specific lipid-transfer protein type 2 n=1 Tax=Lupinus albus TaxID=3870 RepID=A0A6A4PUD7_LUPAL|nr:putative non-specific lipid-transfer protein type 2 [Lupinus albus]
MKKVCVVCGMVLVLLLLLVELYFKVDALNCNPMELSPCHQAITSTVPPTTTCSQKFMEQKPC